MNRTVSLTICLGLGAAWILSQTTSMSTPAIATAVVTGICAVFWVLEPIPIAATSLLPFAVFPFAGVASHKEVAHAYGHHLILLLMGGFILSKAIESVGVHRRIALGLVRATGGTPRRLVLGFMLASALCSMWISNTATALMLLPVALAVLQDQEGAPLRTPLLLGIAYAASIGGMGTPIGTPPNVFFVAYAKDHLGIDYSFLRWMGFALPAVCVLIPLAWLYLCRHLEDGETAIDVPKPGPWTSAERRVSIIFAITALAWMFRNAPLGGWSGLLGTPGVGDSTIALAGVVALFLVRDREGQVLLTWKQAESIPWGLLLLFGGGIAIAHGFGSSGLGGLVGAGLAQMVSGPLPLVVLGVCLGVTFMTEVVSNTATTNLLVPLLFAAASSAGVDPERLLVPATLSASCAFMLPVATAPNAIVFGTGHVSAKEMYREGLALNLVAAGLICGASLLLL